MQDILNEKFCDFNVAEKAVMHYCNTHFHPIRVDYKEKFESYNKKVKQESQIKNQPLDSIYACRWTCKHFGHQKPYLMKKNQGKRNNQAILPCGCKMFIYVLYDNQQQCYGVKKLFLEHNHPYGIEEFSMYSSQRQPKGLLEQQTLMLIEHGANTALVTDSLNRSGLKTKPRDIYNIKQKLKFKG
ncbi:uncharacterized protein LOC136081074 [Hydra vulgaris]|uniref:Uncharacterized protein LOC136081074 n=1 Tax=Hydra vulgaris TaxID=6087 RepID=A0ABM4BYY0_HYDVU